MSCRGNFIKDERCFFSSFFSLVLVTSEAQTNERTNERREEESQYQLKRRGIFFVFVEYAPSVTAFPFPFPFRTLVPFVWKPNPTPLTFFNLFPHSHTARPGRVCSSVMSVRLSRISWREIQNERRSPPFYSYKANKWINIEWSGVGWTSFHWQGPLSRLKREREKKESRTGEGDSAEIGREKEKRERKGKRISPMCSISYPLHGQVWKEVKRSQVFLHLQVLFTSLTLKFDQKDD